VDDPERDGDVEEARAVDGRVAETRRGEIAVVQRDQPSIAAPVEQRQREAVRPDEHERVALDDLEESGEDRGVERPGAGEAVARRHRNARIARGRLEEDELAGEQHGVAARQRDPVDPRELGVGAQRHEREARLRVLAFVAERETLRPDGRGAKPASTVAHEPRLGHEGRGVALRRFAERRREGRVGVGRARAGVVDHAMPDGWLAVGE
jgi:hypothetical protein